MSSSMPTRRTVVRTAAWTVPAVTVVGAAPQFAASTLTHQDVTRTFEFTDALSNIVTVQVTAHIPLDVHPGEQLDVPTTSSIIDISEASLNLLKAVLGSPAFIGGTSNSTTEYSGALVTSTTAALTIANSAVPAAGGITLNASGAAPASTIPAGTPAGVVTLTIGNPQSTLVGYAADGTTQTGTFPSNLNKIAGNDYTLGTFTIHDA